MGKWTTAQQDTYETLLDLDSLTVVNLMLTCYGPDALDKVRDKMKRDIQCPRCEDPMACPECGERTGLWCVGGWICIRCHSAMECETEACSSNDQVEVSYKGGVHLVSCVDPEVHWRGDTWSVTMNLKHGGTIDALCETEVQGKLLVVLIQIALSKRPHGPVIDLDRLL